MKQWPNWLRAGALVAGSNRWECGGNDGLHIKFVVVKNQKSMPNKADITISNLTEKNRRIFATTDMPIRLEAGYVGHSATIFVGTLTHSHSRRWGRPRGEHGPYKGIRDGADVNTVIAARDAERAYNLASIRKSFTKHTPRLVVVKEVAKALGVPLDPSQLELVTGEYVGGYVVSGSAASYLDNICQTLDLEWSVQDGSLQFVPIGGTTTEPAVLLSPETGLLDLPTDIEDAVPQWTKRSHFGKSTTTSLKQQSSGLIKSRKPRIVRVCFMNPSIRIGRAIRLESKALTGNFRCLELKHEGDTHSELWQTTVVMEAI